jgi:CysZ protein
MKDDEMNPPVMSISDVFPAFGRAARDIFSPSVFWRIAWPPVAALCLCVALGLWAWAGAIAFIEPLLPAITWSGWEWLTHWAAVFLLIAALFGVFYFTSVLLVALVVLPSLINYVAARDFPDLARQGERVFIGSVLTTVGALLIFLVGGLLSLPFFLIPGAMLVIPLLWTSWLNQRTFRFDALAEHASRAELATLIERGKGTFFIAGLGCAALAHIPLLNLLVPGYTALVFVHLGLGRLRTLRQMQGELS